MGKDQSVFPDRMADVKTVPGGENPFKQEWTKDTSEQMGPFPHIRIRRKTNRPGKTVALPQFSGRSPDRNANPDGKPDRTIEFDQEFDPLHLLSCLGLGGQTSLERPFPLP